MSAPEVAGDQLKCVRALSVILADGSLPIPETWAINTFPGYDPPIAPELTGLFMISATALPAGELWKLLQVYAEAFGLELEEKPHGSAGLTAVHARGTWQGVSLHIWGPARAEEAAS